MLKYFLLTLSCIAISPAVISTGWADVIALDGAVVVGNGRDAGNDDRDDDDQDYYRSNAYGLGRSLYDYDNTLIINNSGGGSSGTLIVDDGKVIRPDAGAHILNNGQSINVDENGRASGRIGDVDINR